MDMNKEFEILQELQGVIKNAANTVSRLMELKKQFKEKTTELKRENDWEIVSFAYPVNNGTVVTPRLENGLFRRGHEEMTENYFLREGYPIFSVRRPSDNSVWEIGEDTPDGKIKSFEKYNEYHIKVNLEGNKYLWFHTLCKLPERTTEKPPIGIMPEYFWKGQRLYELNQAMIRYIDVGLPYPKEWYMERENLISELKSTPSTQQ